VLFGERSLIVKIANWQLSHNLFPEELGETGRRITLSGTTENAHFLYPREAFIEVWEATDSVDYKSNVNDDGENYLEYGQIQRYESDTENNINAFVNAAIGINDDLFEKVLFLVKEIKTKEVEIELKLSLYGLDLGIASIEDDKWQNKKLLSITGVKFNATQIDFV
jgi:hypothetical protein